MAWPSTEKRATYVSKNCVTDRFVAFSCECVHLPCPGGARRHHRSGSGSNRSFDAQGEGNRHQPGDRVRCHCANYRGWVLQASLPAAGTTKPTPPEHTALL